MESKKKRRKKERGKRKHSFRPNFDAGVGPFLFVMNEKILLLKLFNLENIYRTHVFLLRNDHSNTEGDISGKVDVIFTCHFHFLKLHKT